jgi:hypothetical protein
MKMEFGKRRSGRRRRRRRRSWRRYMTLKNLKIQ